MNNRPSIRSRIAIAICVLTLSSLSVLAETVVLNSDQGDYTVQRGKTYYLTNQVHIAGTATIEAGTVIKCSSTGQLIVDGLDCQTVSTNPAIFTVRDDDRFGDTLPGSAGTPSGYY